PRPGTVQTAHSVVGRVRADPGPGPVRNRDRHVQDRLVVGHPRRGPAGRRAVRGTRHGHHTHRTTGTRVSVRRDTWPHPADAVYTRWRAGRAEPGIPVAGRETLMPVEGPFATGAAAEE